MRKNNQGFIQVILILIIVGLAIGGAYYFGTLKTKTALVSPTSTPVVSQTTSNPTAKPTADPTANWKTYQNTKTGISFKYPESYFVNEIVLDDNTSLIFVDTKKVVIPETWDTNLAPVEIRYNSNLKSASEIVDLAKTQVTPESLSSKQSLVSGINLYTITGRLVEGYMGGENFYEAIFDAPKGVVKLNFWDYFKSGVSVNVAEDILSTFKFTK